MLISIVSIAVFLLVTLLVGWIVVFVLGQKQKIAPSKLIGSIRSVDTSSTTNILSQTSTISSVTHTRSSMRSSGSPQVLTISQPMPYINPNEDSCECEKAPSVISICGFINVWNLFKDWVLLI